MAQQTEIPRSETVWVRYLNKSGDTLFLITSKAARDMYFLYRNDNGKFTKLGRSRSPIELEDRFSLAEKMRA